MPFLKIDNRSFRWLAAELVVVVLGIMIAFQFENWRLDREERRLERSLLQGILRNLEAELSNISRARERYQFQYGATIRLASNVANIHASTEKELAQNYADATFGTFFFATAPTYMGARDSGLLSLVSDADLLNEFNYYFETRIPFVERFTEYISSRRDAFFAVSARDIYLSPSAVFEGIENYHAIEVIRRSGDTYFVVLNMDLGEIPQNLEFYSSLGSLSGRLDGGIDQLNQLEEETESLIVRVKEHLASI